MFDWLKRALLRMLQRLQAIEKKLHDALSEISKTHQTVQTLNQRVADLELHNAGMHAALTNLLLRNEGLLQELDRSVRDQTALLKKKAMDDSGDADTHQIDQSAQSDVLAGLSNSGPTT